MKESSEKFDPSFLACTLSSEPTRIDRMPMSCSLATSYRFRDKKRFQSKFVNFPTPRRAFNTLLKGFHLELASIQDEGVYQAEKFSRFVSVSDGQTDTGRQLVPR